MPRRSLLSRTGLTLLFGAGLWLHSSSAQAFAIGGHLGLNLDHGDIHVGADMIFPMLTLSPQVDWALWPSFAHVFVLHGHDVELLGADAPFLFKLDNVPIVPFVGPGFGLAIYEKVSLKFNLIGGVFMNPSGSVKPFGELALRFIDGVFVDLLFGVVVEL